MSFFRSLVFLLSALVAFPAAAQRGGARQAEQEIERLLDESRQAYDNLELDQADAALDQAVQLGERNDVRGRVMAEVHVQRGIIAHVRDKDKERAIGEFKQALMIDRTVQLDSLVSTPSLEALFDQARRQVGPAGRDGGDARATDIIHKPVKRTRANDVLTIQAKVTRDLRDQMYKIFLYFRSQKADAVRRIEMKDQGDDTFVARIAARFVRGSQLGYYILVEDRDGNQIAQVHGANDPILVEIETMATGDTLTGEEGGDDEGGDEEGGDEPPSKPLKRRIVTLGFSVGTGAGRITDKAEAQNRPGANLQPGVAISPFHTLGELDFWVTPKLALGAFGRIQIADFAPAGGMRIKFDVFQAGSSHIMLRAGGGYGHISHQVPLDGYRDYTLEGPYFYTLGFNWALDFAKRWSFVVAPDFFHLIGPSPSQHVDLNLGVQVSF